MNSRLRTPVLKDMGWVEPGQDMFGFKGKNPKKIGKPPPILPFEPFAVKNFQLRSEILILLYFIQIH